MFVTLSTVLLLLKPFHLEPTEVVWNDLVDDFTPLFEEISKTRKDMEHFLQYFEGVHDEQSLFEWWEDKQRMIQINLSEATTKMETDLPTDLDEIIPLMEESRADSVFHAYDERYTKICCY